VAKWKYKEEEEAAYESKRGAYSPRLIYIR
jgi:hypothetical protein